MLSCTSLHIGDLYTHFWWNALPIFWWNIYLFFGHVVLVEEPPAVTNIYTYVV
jgi:hypothetical protein